MGEWKQTPYTLTFQPCEGEQSASHSGHLHLGKETLVTTAQ